MSKQQPVRRICVLIHHVCWVCGFVFSHSASIQVQSAHAVKTRSRDRSGVACNYLLQCISLWRGIHAGGGQQRCVRLHCRKVEWEAAISLQTNCISVHGRLRPAWSLGEGNHVSQAGLWMEDECDASHPYFTAAPRSNPTCRLQHLPPLWWKFERSFSQNYCQLLHPRYRCFLAVASGGSGGLRPCRIFNAKICIRHYSGGSLFLPAALWGKRWADPCTGGVSTENHTWTEISGVCLWKWHYSHMNLPSDSF